MSTLEDMREYCETCSEELEIGQIGECDGCQCRDSVVSSEDAPESPPIPTGCEMT